MRLTTVLATSLLLACSTTEATAPTDAAASPSDTASGDVTSDVGAIDTSESTSDAVEDDVPGDDATVPDDATAPDEIVPATDYCERAVDAFCPYYVRCGRMAVPDEATCRTVFLETCNARYEPVYADFAARGSLTLSGDGIAACTAHLATVACEAQLGDLDGPCGEMWLGQAPAGAACGPGIESLICDAASTCRIDLSFCGTCVPLALPGTPCDPDHRCPDDGTCVDGACVPRVQTGENCDETSTCETGAGCVEDPDGGTTRCLGPTIVALGEACDGERRCPYKAVCSGGTCKATSLLGEACTPAIGCASGSCTGGTCVPLGGTGAPCQTGLDCVSGRCAGTKTCAPLGPACP